MKLHVQIKGKKTDSLQACFDTLQKKWKDKNSVWCFAKAMPACSSSLPFISSCCLVCQFCDSKAQEFLLSHLPDQPKQKQSCLVPFLLFTSGWFLSVVLSPWQASCGLELLFSSFCVLDRSEEMCNEGQIFCSLQNNTASVQHTQLIAFQTIKSFPSIATRCKALLV